MPFVYGSLHILLEGKNIMLSAQQRYQKWAGHMREDFNEGRQSGLRTAAYRMQYAALLPTVPMLTTKELAERWRISVSKLKTLREGKHGPPFVRLGEKTYRYPLPWVERYEVVGSPPVFESRFDASIIRKPESDIAKRPLPHPRATDPDPMRDPYLNALRARQFFLVSSYRVFDLAKPIPDLVLIINNELEDAEAA